MHEVRNKNIIYDHDDVLFRAFFMSANRCHDDNTVYKNIKKYYGKLQFTTYMNLGIPNCLLLQKRYSLPSGASRKS